MDEDQSGLISTDELRATLRNMYGENISDEQVEEIIRRVDYDKNGEINYSEFLSATINETNLN